MSQVDSAAPRIAVVGSVSLDVVTEVAHLPTAGETILATGSRTHTGGKGANQAVAAALAGAQVAFVGRVGEDETGERLREALRGHDVDVSALDTVSGARSGVAYIAVSSEDNQIVVDAGANLSWDLEDPLGAAAAAEVAGAAVTVCQLEVPVAVVAAAHRHTRGRFILNAAPSIDGAEELIQGADPLVVNQQELAVVSGGLGVEDVEEVKKAHAALLASGVRSVVTTLGPEGAIWTDAEGGGHQPAARVRAVDSTGAGDAFVGVLATAIGRGESMAEAVALATAAASVSVQADGTHDSYPTYAEIAEARLALPPAVTFAD